MKNRILLWLDDDRNPFDAPHWVEMYAPDIHYEGGKVIWVKNYDEYVKWITTNGLPYKIAFDHDLADEHYTPAELWNDMEASKKYQDAKDYTEKTGMDCAHWLVDYCLDNKIDLPLWVIQSANPVGACNIRGLLMGFAKFKLKLNNKL